MGYRNLEGQQVPYATTFDGLYKRATGVAPFKLPATLDRSEEGR